MTERRPGSGGGDDGFEEEDGARAQLEGPEQATSGLRDGLPPFWRTVPVDLGEVCPLPEGLREEARVPRDGSRLGATSDLLFVGRLWLAATAVGAKWAVVAAGAKPAAAQSVYLESRDGALLQPLSGRATDGVELPGAVQRLRPGRLARRLLRERFFDIRRLALDPGEWTVSVGGVVLAKGGAPMRRPERDALVRGLRWPFSEDGDPLLTAPGAAIEAGLGQLERWQDAADFDVLCPFDGPVKVSLAELVSPGWTWRRLCGRHWGLAVCPHCLGSFACRLLVMN